jgi:hypothetical protein
VRGLIGDIGITSDGRFRAPRPDQDRMGGGWTRVPSSRGRHRHHQHLGVA